ncbi:MAG: NYN domain-containing protein [Bacillota bacterium]|nr:MAG: NYN domain-containing protein [Bacillota bacterium]
MDQAAVFIDGGYLSSVLRQFGKPRIRYEQLARWACEGYKLYRVYYYDCPPYQSSVPSKEERERVKSAQSFFKALERLDRFVVRLGRLAYRGTDDDGNPVFVQKRVDLQLGLDIATLVTERRADLIVLISGDSDLIPAVEMARNRSVLVRLIHGPKGTYHQDLWDLVDERREITKDVLQALSADQDS